MDGWMDGRIIWMYEGQTDKKEGWMDEKQYSQQISVDHGD